MGISFAKIALVLIASGGFFAAGIFWFLAPVAFKTSSELGLKFSGTSEPRKTWTFRSKCLAYKCGSDGRISSGQSVNAYFNFENKNEVVPLLSGTEFKYIDSVAAVEKPGKLVAILPDSESGIEVGDFVYNYAEWGEGCITAWHEGRGFAYNDENEKSKNEIECIPTYDWDKNADMFKEIEPMKSDRWIYAEVTVGGNTRNLYILANNDVIEWR